MSFRTEVDGSKMTIRFTSRIRDLASAALLATCVLGVFVSGLIWGIGKPHAPFEIVVAAIAFLVFAVVFGTYFTFSETVTVSDFDLVLTRSVLGLPATSTVQKIDGDRFHVRAGGDWTRWSNMRIHRPDFANQAQLGDGEPFGLGMSGEQVDALIDSLNQFIDRNHSSLSDPGGTPDTRINSTREVIG